MIRFFINIIYIPDPDSLSDKVDEIGSKTHFLAFCMHAAGVYRLFDKASVYEFLFRLAILFRHRNIMQKFFTNDTLIEYEGRDAINELCLKDISEHLGIELSDHSYNMVEREDWLAKIETYWKNACMVGVITGKAILDSRVIGKNKFMVGSNGPESVTHEDIKAANLFATEASKTIGEQAFLELSHRISDRTIYLEECRNRLLVKPEHTFDYSKIPWDVKTWIYIKIFGSIKDKKMVFQEIEQPECTLAALIHLAWLWVNGYVTVCRVCINGRHAYTAEVDGRMDFDYSKYDGLNSLGFGINLYDTFYDYNLDKIMHRLQAKPINSRKKRKN